MPSGRLARAEPDSAGEPALPADLQHPSPRRSRRRRRRPPPTRCHRLVLPPRPAAASRMRERTHSPVADLDHRRTPGRDHLPTPRLSLWRTTLRRFPLVSSRTASPRPLPSRRQALPDPRRVAATKIEGPPRPQGLAPLTSPLRGPVLPPHLARSSLGLAYQIEPDPGANRRPVGPPGRARRRRPLPGRASGGETPPDRATRRRSTPRRRMSAGATGPNPTSRQARQRKVDGADSARPSPALDGVQRGSGRFSRIKVGVSNAITAAQPECSWGPAEATTRPARGSQPDLGAHRTEVRALHPRCTAEATQQPKPRGWPARQPGGQALTSVRDNEIGATTRVTRHVDNGSSVSGSQRPSMPPSLHWMRRALTRRPHAPTAPSKDSGCRLPDFTRKEGKRKETPALRPARRRARGGQVPMEQFLGARQTRRRRALLRAHAARRPDFEEPPRFYL